MQNDSVSQQLWAMLCTHKYCYCLYFYECSPYRLNFQSSSLGLRAGGRKRVRETGGNGRWREGGKRGGGKEEDESIIFLPSTNKIYPSTPYPDVEAKLSDAL